MSAMKASSGEMKSMKMKASTPPKHCTTISGANVEYAWTLRMSLLARLINCPDCTRSKKLNESHVRCS